PVHAHDGQGDVAGDAGAVLVGHHALDLDLGRTVGQGVDDRRVALVDDAAAHLAGAGDLVVVGVELLVEEHEAPDPHALGQILVGPGDLLGQEFADLPLAGQVGVGRVAEATVLGPGPHGRRLDGEHGGDVRRPLLPEDHGLFD